MVNGKSIQVDDGEFTRVHNAIFEALARARLSGSEFRCVMFLFRKTYGWNKKEDVISLSQWAEGTDSKRPHVLTTLNSLLKKNIIYRRLDGGQIPTYGFNKYIEQWTGIEVQSEMGNRFQNRELLPEQVTVTKTGNTTVTNTGNGTVTKTGTHKRHKDKVKDKESGFQNLMFGALVKLCMIDAKVKRGQIARTAKTLLDAGYIPEDIEHFSEWWRAKDFRGKRGEPPTLGQVTDKILQAKQDFIFIPNSTSEPVYSEEF